MTPLGNKVIIAPIIEEEKTTEAGLVLLATENQLLKKGIVVSISDDIESDSGWRLLPGKTVLYAAGAGVSIEGGLIMEFNNVWAIL